MKTLKQIRLERIYNYYLKRAEWHLLNLIVLKKEVEKGATHYKKTIKMAALHYDSICNLNKKRCYMFSKYKFGTEFLQKEDFVKSFEDVQSFFEF